MRALAFLTCAVLLGTSCREHATSPPALLDGSVAQPRVVRLESVARPAVFATTRIELLGQTRDPLVASCRGQPWSDPPAGRAVLRIGVVGASVTFSRLGQSARACDTTRLGVHRPRWCGVAYGRLVRRRLQDPRLDVGGCTSHDGMPVAFAWIQPRSRTRYVVVHHRGFAEVYEAAAGLPVRVASSDGIDLARSSAAFEISEHDANGRLISRYELDARAAG
jgi:hypothetical protein